VRADEMTLSETIEIWKLHIVRASNEQEVVLVMRSFVESLSPVQRVLIGPECEPESIASKDSVAECAVRLTREELAVATQDPAASLELQRIASVFIEGTRRLSALSYEAQLLNLEKPAP
jgi:hypothetical protein